MPSTKWSKHFKMGFELQYCYNVGTGVTMIQRRTKNSFIHIGSTVAVARSYPTNIALSTSALRLV